jgi:hypothetical protein
MEDQKPKSATSRSLSEISHLFLSSVRDRQTQGSERPQRKPPQSEAKPSVDLTPEEFAQVFAPDEAAVPVPLAPPVRLVIGSHLGSRQLECVKRYARNLAASGSRVGLIFADVSEFRLLTFQPAEAPAESADGPETCVFDVRAMRDAINELNCDLDYWLLSVANPRVSDARALLRGIDRWVLLSACDHDGIVAAYRGLKGLAELGHPRISLAALDAREPAEAQQVFRKLSNVCREFLGRSIEPEPAVGDAPHVDECQVMCCRTAHDKAQLAAAGHWQVIGELLAKARKSAEEPPAVTPAPPPIAAAIEMSAPSIALPESPISPTGPTMNFTSPPSQSAAEVIDLPAGDASVLDAIMKHSMNEVVECPLRPPMCPGARIAVSRDRRIILIAAAAHGLADLKSIGQAYRWLVENRSLLAMALPQFALDAHQLPHLRLLVDQADLDAEILQPIFHVDTVTIQTYRRVRWGERSGLLLNAA